MDKILTKKEEEMMAVLWEQWEHNQAALTALEILEASPNRTWKKNSLHLLINGLLKKGAIEVHDFKKSKTSKNYARTFRPTLDQYDYLWLQMTTGMDKENRKKLISSIITNLDRDELSIAKERIEEQL